MVPPQIDWTQVLTVAVPAVSAAVVAVCQCVAYALRLRASLLATPEQIRDLETVKPPGSLIERGGPALVLVCLSAAVAAALYTGHAELVRRSGAPDFLAQQRVGDFQADLRPDGLPVGTLVSR